MQLVGRALNNRSLGGARAAGLSNEHSQPGLAWAKHCGASCAVELRGRAAWSSCAAELCGQAFVLPSFCAADLCCPADRLAVNLTDNLAHNLADNLADNLTVNLAHNLADNLADNLVVENLADNLAHNLADELLQAP